MPTVAEFRTMDLPIPRIAYYVAGASAVVVFVAAFLPWFSVSTTSIFGNIGQSGSGTDSPMLGGFTLLLSLAVLAALVLLVVRPDPRLWLTLPICGALIVVLALISLARISSGSGDLGILQAAIHVSAGVGLWLTVLGGLGLLLAALLTWRERSPVPTR